MRPCIEYEWTHRHHLCCQWLQSACLTQPSGRLLTAGSALPSAQGRPIVINAVLQHPGRHEDAVLQQTARGTRAAPRPRKDTEAILCSLRKAHEASITSILVTNDQGAMTFEAYGSSMQVY